MKEELIGCELLDREAHSNLIEMMCLYLKHTSPRTYWVRDKRLQCDGGKNRSFDDLLLLSKNYYPDTTIEELVNVVSKAIELVRENGKNSIIYYCSTIEKPIVWKRTLTEDHFCTSHRGFYSYKDYRETNLKGVSKWSLFELYNMLEPEKEEV
jgi:hypothetical protein